MLALGGLFFFVLLFVPLLPHGSLLYLFLAFTVLCVKHIPVYIHQFSVRCLCPRTTRTVKPSADHAPKIKTWVLFFAFLKVKNLEDVVLQFTLGRGDVLLATSIIENGIDMPNVNSIVVMVRLDLNVLLLRPSCCLWCFFGEFAAWIDKTGGDA